MQFQPDAIRKTSSVFLAVFLLNCLLVTIGCGGGGSSSPSAGAPSSITISPQSSTLAAGSAVQFVGTTNNNTGVSWQVNGVAGGSSGAGTISSAGLYNAPAVLPSGPVTVTAVSQVMPSLVASATLTITNTNANHDPLGTVASANAVSCSDVGADQGVAGSTCYQLVVSCPDVSQEDPVDLKVNAAAAPLGTILFTAGGGGKTWYDQEFTYGTDAVNQVIAGNFTAVQLLFESPVGYSSSLVPSGWLSGPGGVRKLSCRWATAAQWVHDNLLAANAAFCATGNSAGSSAMSYSITHYGMQSVFDFFEQTSGPPMARIDQGCVCNSAATQSPCGSVTQSSCYGVDGNMFIDPAYASSICSSAESTHSTTNQDTFIDDSILAPDANLVYPHLAMHFLFGGLDAGAAPTQAAQYLSAVSAKGAVTSSCVADAPHAILDAQDGANQVAADLLSMCHR
ncbi:MAG: hypothetical protein H0X25_00165 [Acidobacteriales bacterium]|nr:hypothetical protein [Terriglobales bacterium]